jgi:chromosome segregation ATPase
LNDAQDELLKLKAKKVDVLTSSNLKAVEEQQQLIIEQLMKEKEKLQADIQNLSTQNRQLALREEEQKRKLEAFEQQIHSLQEEYVVLASFLSSEHDHFVVVVVVVVVVVDVYVCVFVFSYRKLLNTSTDRSSGVILGAELQHEEERTKLLNDYKQLTQTLEVLQQKYHNLEEQHHKLTEEYQNIRDHNNTLKENITQLTQQHTHNENTVKNLLLQTQQQNDEIERLKKELSQLSIERDTLQRERESLLQQFQNETLRLNEEKQKLSESLHQQIESFKALKSQYDEQTQRMTTLLQEKTLLDSTLKKLTEQVTSYEHELSLLKQTQQNELIERLNKQQENMNTQRQLEEENAKLKKQHRQFSQNKQKTLFLILL